MTEFLIRRLGLAFLVVLLTVIAQAALVRVLPGDPVRLVMGPRASEAFAAQVRAEMELDLPVHEQVFNFVLRALRGDLGRDFLSSRPVASLIGDVLPHTLALALTSLGMAIVLGLPLGVIAAAQPGGWLDQVLGAVSITFVTLPTYVIGLVGLLVFAVGLGWLPAIGAGDAADPGDYLRHLILPASALALTWVGYLARLVRASMLEVLSAPFIRTARAYGLGEWRILFRHALANALIPTVAVLGVGLGNLLGGAIFVEFIFDRPGLGQLIFTSIGERNYPVVRGGVLTAALMFVLANLLADLVQRWLNPRLRSR